MEWIWGTWDSVKHILLALGIRTVADLVAAVGAPIVAVLLFRLWRWLRRAKIAEDRIQRASAAVAKQDGPFGETEGKGLWLAEPIFRPKGYPGWFGKGLPVLVIANLKGGVGKTTLAANLAAFFAKEKTNECCSLI